MKNKMNRLIAITVFVVLCLSFPEYMLGQGQIKRQRQARQESVQISNPDGYINGHGYVDLGLPSGTKWATCNIGAADSTGVGDFFAWAETSAIYKEGEYHWKNTDLGNIAGQLQYDAATYNWGDPWKMPNTRQLEELIDVCKWKYVDYKGKKGYIITGPNKKSIFLPSGGRKINNQIYYDGYHSLNYWSASPHESGRNYPAAMSDFNTVNKPAKVWWVDYFFAPDGKPMTSEDTYIAYNIRAVL